MRKNWIHTTLLLVGVLTASALVFLAALFTPLPATAASDSLNQTVSSVAEQTKQAIEETSKAALSEIEQLWQKIDAHRLKNRTRDEIVAWVIMGLLVGGALGQVIKMNRLGAVTLGLLGAFLGGLVVHLAEIDLGLGPVLIRYEDLLFSLLGSLLVVFGIRLLMRRKQPKT